MKPLERDHAAECLRRVLLLENKLEFTKAELLAHEIMDQWAERDYEDTFPFEIARNLSKDMSLENYYTKLLVERKSQERPAVDQSIIDLERKCESILSRLAEFQD